MVIQKVKNKKNDCNKLYFDGLDNKQIDGKKRGSKL